MTVGTSNSPRPQSDGEFNEPCRGDRLIASARQAFVEKGFEGTSMQDVARAAQMSVGNLYRYFPSKMAIIEALIARHFTGVEDELDAMIGGPDPLRHLRATLQGRLVRRHAGDRVLSAEIAACVARTPDLAAVVATRMEGLSSRLAWIIGSACNLLEPAALHRARAVLLIMHGALTSPPIPGWEGEQVTDDVLSVLDRVIQGSGDAA